MINKKKVEGVLNNVYLNGHKTSIIENNFVKNIIIFNNEVEIDIDINHPTLHVKKKLENDIIEQIKKLSNDIKIKLRIRVISKKNTLNETISGKKLENIKNIIAIASGKGGVGKSTITSNIAISLNRLGFKVGVLDADIYGPSQHIMFDVEKSKPSVKTIKNKSVIVPVLSYGIKLLSIGFFTNNSQALVWRGPMATKALNQLINDSDWGNLDYLLVDLPPGTGDIHLSLIQSVSVTGAVIVSTPQNIALADAKKGVKMFQYENINIPIIGLIENMSYFVSDNTNNKKHYIFGKDGVKNLSDDLNLNFLGEVPLSTSIRESSDVGHPTALQENSENSKIFHNLAKSIVNKVNYRNKNIEPSKIVKIKNMDGC